jgi:stalled ribosome alternative rescue factor ArfA
VKISIAELKKIISDAMKPRNATLAAVLKNDPARFRSRTVLAKKGKGRKNRPRKSNRCDQERGDE